MLATGRHAPHEPNAGAATARLDVLDRDAVCDIVADREIDTIYHLAAVLSARGEHDPETTWRINIDGLRNVLEAARQREGCRVFWPSSIAAFGPDTPRDRTPQDSVMRPTTIYGNSEVAGELLGSSADDSRARVDLARVLSAP